MPSRWRISPLGAVSIAAVGLLTVAAVVVFGNRDQWEWLTQSDEPLTNSVVAVPITEIDNTAERLYRITPSNGSNVSYQLIEHRAGSENTVTGTTSVVAGDVVINIADPARSRIGEIVVNVETFSSDSRLRDKRIRHDFLESSHWPFARFVATSIDGLDVDFVDNTSYDIAITGDLTVKETTLSQTFSGIVTVTPDQLIAEVSTVVLSSDYDVGPINITRLVRTHDEVTLAFKLVADRVELGAESTDNSAVTTVDVATPATPADGFINTAFATTVQPILERRCVTCHTSGGPGWSTLALDTAADAADISDDIAFVTQINYMPPWLPSDLSPDFEHDWSLNDHEKALISEWASAGGGLDVAPDTPLLAHSPEAAAISEDQKIGPRDGPYTGYADADGRPLSIDDYRCQVHEVADPEGDGIWLKGFEFRPDATSIVHHALVFRVPASAADEIKAKIKAQNKVEKAEGLSDEPGWPCFDRTGLRTPGISLIQGWAPGQVPTIYPDGYGLYLAPGDVIVNQIHYHFDHETLPDNSLVVLDVATSEEIKAGITHVTGDVYLTPAEVPCTATEMAIAAERADTDNGYVNMCIRDNVLKEIDAKYGPLSRLVPDALLFQCGGTVDDYDDLTGKVGYSSCDLPAEDTGTIFGVLGHMHEFGSSYRMTLHPDTDEELILLDIPKWDFEWQLRYKPVDDIHIEQGDTVRFECWWDRSLKQMDEPRYITWANGTEDEMCFSSITVLPDL